jgi:hypothetical protein
MKKDQRVRIGAWALLGLTLTFMLMWNKNGEKVDFNTQIKPIFNQHCISCHGGVKANGNYSLLFEEEAFSAGESGKPALVPGKPGKSELIRRITISDPEMRMPFDKPPLSDDEIRTLKDWIRQGAQWDQHWAYQPVREVKVPEEFTNRELLESRARNEIDHFIFQKLEPLGLTLSPRADLADLARRLSIDLIGLPAPVEIYRKLLAAPNEKGLDNYVDSLLASPHFGEKWTGMWLDLARYADTKGYERDDSRTIWKYRDWLIRAFNDDKPYDEFLVEQIAGDLLPSPTDDQLLATAFHRNTMTNDEGGTDNEEFRVAAVMDRVNTTWEVLQGTTFSCVQCHSHPYDPIRMEEYYHFMAFFNNTRDEDTFSEYPVLRHFEKDDSAGFEQLTEWLTLNTHQSRVEEIAQFIRTWQPSINSLTSDQFVNSELADTKWLVFRNQGSARLKKVHLNGKTRMIARYRTFLDGGTYRLHLDDLNGPVIAEVFPSDTKGKWTFAEIPLQVTEGTHDLYLSYENPQLENPYSNGLMFDWFYFDRDFPGEGKEGYQDAKTQFWHLVTTGGLQTPIMIENPVDRHRETHVFDRGNWLVPLEVVQPDVPGFMPGLPEGLRHDRLAMARWLSSRDNPLTARVLVNRVWEQLFGRGMVETLEDFGSQGSPPTHPELLDYLAYKFMYEFDWSLKLLLRYIVTSATYRQTSSSQVEQLAVDPQNRYLSRGPRIRLSAEQVRDQALVVSGLFSTKMFGPSVMPYQPDGIWNSPYNGRKWVQDTDDNQYRRALYTYWKRTSPYPSMLLFDMVAREVCSSRRISTNTPLQALVTLNDSVYIGAANRFALRMIEEGGREVEEQIRYGYRLMLGKDITPEKLDVLISLYHRVKNNQAIQVALREDRPWDPKHDQAMKIVANAMLNLDEFLVKN